MKSNKLNPKLNLPILTPFEIEDEVWFIRELTKKELKEKEPCNFYLYDSGCGCKKKAKYKVFNDTTSSHYTCGCFLKGNI